MDNFKKTIMLFLSVFIVASLTACMGGGGGGVKPGDTAGKVVTVPMISESGEFPAITHEGTYGSGVSTNETSTTQSASVEYDEDGSVISITIDSPTAIITWNKVTGDEFLVETVPDGLLFPAVYAKSIGIGEKRYGIFSASTSMDMSYQAFGLWSTENEIANAGSVGALSAGGITPQSVIPEVGEATFSGYSIGVYAKVPGSGGYVTSSDLSVGVDFGTRELSFNTVNTRQAGTGLSAGHLDMSGTLTYSSTDPVFRGTLTTESGLSGATTGRFYGPGAEELGGVFEVSKQGGLVSESYKGAYGAKR
ncbi:MAG: transferrin-binding protein-like solute binding protein [Candidatus Sedimenticola sp. PURPLELP]